jgi:hypothetical protein
MRAAGYSITENDPFEEKPVIIFNERELSRYVSVFIWPITNS